jgi:hypothetical protein
LATSADGDITPAGTGTVAPADRPFIPGGWHTRTPKRRERTMSSNIGPGADRDDRAYLAAKKRVDALLGFYIHLLAYVSVNLALFVINVLTRNDGGYWWFYWPLAGGGCRPACPRARGVRWRVLRGLEGAQGSPVVRARS